MPVETRDILHEYALELFGIDVMIGADGRPWLLEVSIAIAPCRG